MHRIVAYILAAWFVLLGTGVVQYAHELEHQRAACASGCSNQDHHKTPTPARDDGGCTLCTQLHSPTLLNHTILVSLPAMMMIETRSIVASLPVVHTLPRRLDCRGPPAC